MSNSQHETTIRLAFVADASESSPSKILAACTAVGPDVVKAQAIEGAKVGTSKKVDPAKWAHQMSTAAALFVIVYDTDGDTDADTVAADCITRAKASSKSTGECKAKGTGHKLVGAVKALADAKGQKAALADVRKAKGQGRRRGPGTTTGEAALVKAVKAKVAAFEKARVDNSRTVEAKAREILAALDELQKVAQKADECLVTISVAGEELAA